MIEIKELIDRVKQTLENGKFIAIYDGDDREGEVDLVYWGERIKPESIERLRRDAGGLICLAINKETADTLGLPFYTDVFENKEGLGRLVCKKTAYGDKPAFSLQINHKDVYTGITDRDRALTISKFSEIVELIKEGKRELAKSRFYNEFYIPGHVFLLISRGIENRRGHTELATEVMKVCGLSECAVLCEMLGNGTGNAMNKEDAERFCEENEGVFLETKDILKMSKSK